MQLQGAYSVRHRDTCSTQRIDPRQELIQQLVEYKRIKEVVEEIKDLEAQRSLRHTRGNQKAEVEDLIKILADDVELETVSLIKLMLYQNQPVNQINHS